jgi:hypothetical protein
MFKANARLAICTNPFLVIEFSSMLQIQLTLLVPADITKIEENLSSPATSRQPLFTKYLSGLTPSPSADTINSSPTEPGHAGRSRGGFP